MKQLITLLAVLFSATVNAQNVGIGTTTPASKLSVGSNSEFQVDNNGNLKKINNIPTSFPFIQGKKNEILRNDGSGNLSWQKLLPIGTIIQSLSINPELDSMGFEPYTVSHESNAEDFRGNDDGLWTTTAITPPVPLPLTTNDIGNATMLGNNLGRFAYYYKGYIYTYGAVTGIWGTSSLCTLPDFGITRVGVKIAAIGNNLYCLSGETPIAPLAFQSKKSHNTMVVYNFLSNTWSACANLPDSITALGVCTYNNTLYVMGGYKHVNNSNFSTVNSDLYVYNPTINTWTTTTNYFFSLTYGAYPVINPAFFRNSYAYYIAGNKFNTIGNWGQNGSLQNLITYPIASNTIIRESAINPFTGVSMCSKGTDSVFVTFNNSDKYKPYVSIETQFFQEKYLKNPHYTIFTNFHNIGSAWNNDGNYYIFAYDKVYKYSPHQGVAEPTFTPPFFYFEMYNYIKIN
jgi:hypothetical protein